MRFGNSRSTFSAATRPATPVINELTRSRPSGPMRRQISAVASSITSIRLMSYVGIAMRPSYRNGGPSAPIPSPHEPRHQTHIPKRPRLLGRLSAAPAGDGRIPGFRTRPHGAACVAPCCGSSHGPGCGTDLVPVPIPESERSELRLTRRPLTPPSHSSPDSAAYPRHARAPVRRNRPSTAGVRPQEWGSAVRGCPGCRAHRGRTA